MSRRRVVLDKNIWGVGNAPTPVNIWLRTCPKAPRGAEGEKIDPKAPNPG